MVGMLVAGAAWSAKADSPEDTGRQPLAVEAVTTTHASVDGTGGLQPVEHDLNAEAGRSGDGWSVLQLLRLLAVGARRADEVDSLSRCWWRRQPPTL